MRSRLDRTTSLTYIDRRSFLKLSGLGMAALIVPRWQQNLVLPEFPQSDRLGRVLPAKIDVKNRPDDQSETVNIHYEDTVLPWLREVAGRSTYRANQRWVETPDGYIWAPHLQPVRNHPSIPLDSLPDTSGSPGMWAEVCVPYIDLRLENPLPRSPALKERMGFGLHPRLYFSQVVWIDRIERDDSGIVWYRVNEKYGTYGDLLWGDGRAFRPISPGEIEPISPEVEEKRVVVDLTYQTLSCYEGSREVYFARVSTGVYFDINGNPIDKSSTPLGKLTIWRKLVSTHMSGGASGVGWDLSGVGWTTLFAGNGVAIHSTYWHNNFGVPMSRGCVNAQPEDARWVFRWTQPIVTYDPGELTVQWPGGTTVEVIEK
jgi:hypothetical protein